MYLSNDARWHVERSRDILARHPEIRDCFRPYPWSVAWILGLVALQWLVAWQMGRQPWWVVGLVAFFVGQFLMHSLATFIHEASHDRILPGRAGTMISLLLIELGSPSFGKSLEYVEKHASAHHRFVNDPTRDPEWWDSVRVRRLLSRPAWRLFDALLNLLPLGMLASDALVAALAGSDPRRTVNRRELPGWFWWGMRATSLLAYSLAWWALGWTAALYFVWTLSFLVGLWGVTFKGQSIAEHNLEGDGRTASTYGWVNVPFFNTGYHDEHHTFPRVPWVYLPKVREIAREDFANESGHDYIGWWWQWATSGFHPVRFHRTHAPEAAK
jgi:sphingolipid delta-4 desaturase